MSNMRTIRVTGKGQIKVKPDTTRITNSLEGTWPEYGETLRHSSHDTERLKDLLSAFGFARSDLKTLNFNVETEYESYKEKGNCIAGRPVLELLSEEFRLSYTVSDPEAAKNDLLGKAVTDAKEKASVLTQAAGVTLKDIQSIDYSWGEIDFEYRPMNRMLMADEYLARPMVAESPSYDMDIEPDDIEVSDTVTVLWEIG